MIGMDEASCEGTFVSVLIAGRKFKERVHDILSLNILSQDMNGLRMSHRRRNDTG